jgi:hypothetical protein
VSARTVFTKCGRYGMTLIMEGSELRVYMSDTGGMFWWDVSVGRTWAERITQKIAWYRRKYGRRKTA